MKYSITSIDMGSVNLGNRLIEYSLLKLMNLPKPTVKISMFCNPSEEGIRAINQTEFLLLPGSTILAGDAMQSQALSCLPKIKVPVYCFGASGWDPYYKYNPEYLKHITPPIGVRDPHALDFCLANKVDTTLVGCPTVLMPNLSIGPPRFNIVGFARDNHSWQKDILSKMVESPKKCAVQEPAREGTLAKQISQDVFDYKDPEKVFRIYSQSKAVYTGRLHGALPAISQTKPVFFFGHPEDSRFTLIRWLGLEINEFYKDYKTLEPKRVDGSRISRLRENFFKMVEITTGRHKQ